jgi:bleomycin hydrolase
VPLQAYPGRKDGKRDAASGEVLHDHSRMAPEMTSYLQWVKQQGMWDEEAVVAGVRAILDRHLGAPPTEFEYEGKKYTPRTFFQKVVKVGPDDYVQFMSTLSEPFFKTALFDVPDNWWKDDTYHNVPLDVFYDVIVKSVAAGYSIGIGGDVSEPGKDFAHSAAFVPSFDIPSDHIDQSAREYRITNGSTGDDHGVHLVGMADVGGHKWFLIKDSGRSARWAKPEGYYFFRDDFVKLKMLTIMVHKDAVPELVERFEEPGAPRQDESGR